MSKYFFRGTALEELECEMMTIPGFDHRPQAIRPSAECCACIHCKEKLPYIPCLCLGERIEISELTYSAFVRKLYQPFPHIRARLDRHFLTDGPLFFRHEIHCQRWWYWRGRCPKMSDQQKAILYLLTSYGPVWAATIQHMDRTGFDLHNVRLGSLTVEQYAVYQAAKAFAIGSRNITVSDLADRELISDEALRLITGALLIAVFGEVVLKIKK